MKLPENYKNWIEFAKKCNELLQKYPNAKTIKLDNRMHYEFSKDGYVNIREYNINAVKAKAFNEVVELALAAREEVSLLEGSVLTDIAIMTRFLILLAK